jgi:DNA polymerase III sliding clamp (beta) subunit (PCNA family)
MELNRKELLDALKTVDPALSVQNLLPLLRMVWFTGTSVQATDGTIGIEAPAKTDFVGGIPGKVILGFVDSVDSDKLKSTSTESAVTLSSGHSRIKLPLTPPASNPWPFPKANSEGDTSVKIDEEWCAALNHAMLSVTNNTNNDERRGVTFLPTEKFLTLYATDSVSLSIAAMPLPEEWVADRFALPGDFIREILRQVGENGTLVAWENHAEASNDAGVRVLSRMLNVPSPTDFPALVKRLTPANKPVPLPDALKRALERAELLRAEKDAAPASFTFVDKDILVIEASSALGDLREELHINDDHPELTVKFTPNITLRGLVGRETFITSKRALILTGPKHLTYMVAAYEG